MALRMNGHIPSLAGATRWINGEFSIEEHAGKPIVVHFWSMSCYVCHDVAKHIAAWRERFSQCGVAFVAIHQPRSPEELDVDKAIADALGPMGFVQSIAIDNDHAIVERFENHFVPAYYVFDQSHRLRHFQAGDKGYDRIEAAIERVLEPEIART
ncbi:MAG: redoxin domain-containing protein [Candidatus Eremiobacteraeota bacterium]|nr:redoxin domain-containing protein [Candidatus Eremiobacteraeota bacterium]